MATIINGTNDGETIDGTADHDTINALAGNDVIRGKLGNDTLNGGDDNDTFEGATGDGYDVFNGGEGTDDIAWNGIVGIMGSFSLAANKVESITAGGITSFTSSSNTLDFRGVTLDLSGEINGGAGHNTIYASEGDDIIRGAGGNDDLYGLGGGDTFVGQTSDGIDRFFGGAGFDRVDWDNGALRLMDGFGPANSIEQIEAGTITGYSGAGTFDFSRTALKGATLVRGDDEVGGIGHNNIVTSLSRAPDVAANLVYDGGGGNDRVTVTIAPGDFVGSAVWFSKAGLVKDIFESKTANFDTGFTFDDSLGLRVEDFENGLKYGWFTLAGNLAEAALANVKIGANGTATHAGTAGNDLQIGGNGNDLYLGGAGNDLMVGVIGPLVHKYVTGAGDDTIVIAGNRGGRVNDSTDIAAALLTPNAALATVDTGLDQMFVVDGTTFNLGGELNGIEYIEFSDAGGAGEIKSNGTNIRPDLTNTVLSGVNKVTGHNNIDTMVTAKEHHGVPGGLVTYDGGNLQDIATVNFGAFTQINTAGGLYSDLRDLLAPGVNVTSGAFTFDTALDYDLKIQSFGNTAGLDVNRVKLGYVGHDGALVSVTPDATHVLLGAVPSNDTLNGTSGNDILIRGGNGETMNAGAGDDLLIGNNPNGKLHGQDGSDTYLMDGSVWIQDTGTGAGDHDRVLAFADNGHILIHQHLSGIEEINANGFEGVELRGGGSNATLDLSDTFLIGIDTVRTGGNADTIITHSMDEDVTYIDGGAFDTLTFNLTGTQAVDAAAEIAAFNAAAPNANNTWTFDTLGFSIVNVENVNFDFV